MYPQLAGGRGDQSGPCFSVAGDVALGHPIILPVTVECWPARAVRIITPEPSPAMVEGAPVDVEDLPGYGVASGSRPRVAAMMAERSARQSIPAEANWVP